MKSTGLKITDRDRAFMVVAPAILVAVAYFFLAAKPMSQEVASLRARHAELGEPEAIAARRPALEAQLARENALLEEARAADEAVREAAPRSGASPREPAERLRALADLYRANGGRVAASSMAPADAAASRDAARPACAEALARANGVEPRLWRFEVEAGYAEMSRALDALAESRKCVVESLEMLPARDGAAKCAWRLSLWM